MHEGALLTRLRRVRYSDRVAEKEATGFGSPKYTGRRAAPCGYFFVCNASVRLQWAAVVGSLRAAGCRVYRSSNPAIRRPPRLEARCGLTHTHGGLMPGINTPKQSPKPLFKPFSWHVNPSFTIDATLETAARDIAYGIQLALEIIERDELAPDSGEAPILDEASRGVLMRFAISSAHLLGESAERNIAVRNEQNDAVKNGGAHV